MIAKNIEWRVGGRVETVLLILLQCVGIFFARVSDVTLGTIRIIMQSKGERSFAALIGFFEIIIWALVVSQIINNLSNIFFLFSFALGFAAGNYIGVTIDEKIARGYAIVHIVPKENYKLVEKIRQAGFGVTVNPGLGSHDIYHVVLKKKKLPDLIKMVEKEDNKGLYAVTDVRYEHGAFIKKAGKKK